MLGEPVAPPALIDMAAGQTVTLSFPIVVIDFEATALALTSYPIEVGVAIIDEPGAPVRTWSTLIRPDPNWDIDAQWDPDAERVHGIRRWALRDGLEPRAALAELNARIPIGSTVWCDGGDYDLRWLVTLASAAGIDPTFELNDLDAVLRRDGPIHERYRKALGAQARPHRAGPDAECICVAIAQAAAPRVCPTLPVLPRSRGACKSR